jgi:hypothetical protein
MSEIGGLIVLLAMSGAALASTVRVDGGRVQGVELGEVMAYKGIPYAAAPVADLRWRAPQPALRRSRASTAVSSPAAASCWCRSITGLDGLGFSGTRR